MRDETISMVLSYLVTKQTFFATLLFTICDLVEVAADDPKVKRAATDGTTIWINVGYFASLTNAERVFVLTHEILHCVWLHLPRAKSYEDLGVGPDMEPMDMKKWNRAGDYVINSVLLESSVGTMPKGALLSNDYDGTMCIDDVYRQLPDDDDDDDDDDSGGFDDHIIPDNPTTESNGTAMKAAIEQAAMAAKAQGQLPSGLRGIIDNIMNPKVPWEEVLRREMTLAGSNHEASWSKPNRRRLVTSSVIMPASCGSTCGAIACVIDTSGSISNQDACQFLGEIKSICEDNHPEKVYLLWTDAEVAHVDELEDLSDIDSIIDKYTHEPLPGGGGTNMPRAFDYMAEWGIDPTTCVVFTDGMTPYGDAQSYPVIWAITHESYVDRPPHGTSIHCDIA